MNNWISVEDRLPDLVNWKDMRIPEDVLFCSADRKVYVGYFSACDGEWNDAITASLVSDVTHWMPFPEAP